jgi:hypothetical protein
MLSSSCLLRTFRHVAGCSAGSYVPRHSPCLDLTHHRPLLLKHNQCLQGHSSSFEMVHQLGSFPVPEDGSSAGFRSVVFYLEVNDG